MGKIITQIGSLPYKNVNQALKYSFKHDIPFLPELPKNGDAITDYIKNPGTLSCLKEFKKEKFDIVKVQCAGPALLMTLGYDEETAIKRIYEHIEVIITGLEANQIILFLDEPTLGQAGFDFEELWMPIFTSFNVIPGIHTCGTMDWDKLFKSKLIEIISFDASQFDITNYSGYRSGKRIAWGIKSKDDVKDFQEGDLLTLPCGLGSGLYTTEDCQKEFRKLNQVAQQLLF